MYIPTHIQPFWKSFEAAIGHGASSRFYDSFHFDDNEKDANELGNLVLQGQKRATAGLLWANEMNNKPIPRVGDLSVVTNWQQEPLCIIETTQVEIVPYEEVSEACDSQHEKKINRRFLLMPAILAAQQPPLYFYQILEVRNDRQL